MIEYGELKPRVFRNGGAAQTVLDGRFLFLVFAGYTRVENNSFSCRLFKDCGGALGKMLFAS